MGTLKPNIEGWSLVMVGHWNRMIFSPEWITRHLTQSKDIGIELPVDNPQLPPRLTFDDLHLSVTQRRVALSVTRPEDALLERCRNVAVVILKVLSHTPLAAVGVNYQFLAEEPGDELLGVFELKDNNRLSDANVRIRTTVIQRNLLIDNQTINLSLTLDERQKVHVSFNFHADTPTTDGAISFLSSHSTDLKQKAFELLNTVYKSTVESLGETP